MVTLKRIGVKSAGLIGFWFGAALIMTQITFFIVLFAIESSSFPRFLFSLDFWIVILQLIISVALQTAIFFGASAYIYNLVSNLHGGLKLEFEPVDSATAKRKNDEIPSDESDDDDDNGSSAGDNKKRITIE